MGRRKAPPPAQRAPPDAPPKRAASLWLAPATLVAVAVGVVLARLPSAALRGVERQLAVGRQLFERGAWAASERALGDDLRAAASKLARADDLRAAWPRLHEASAHRAQAALRAADHVADAGARRGALERAAALFAAAVDMDGAALRFYDFVHDYCRCLRRLGRPGAADGVFEASRNASGASFPWAGAPAQMPCCGALAPAAVLPVEGERPWHDVGAHAVAAVLAARAADIVAEAARALAGGLELASLEGHGVELMGGPTGAALGPAAAPWRELLLFDSAGGWREEPCAQFPTVCDILRDAPQVVGAPTAVAVDGAGFCCRVEILRLDARGHILPHTAPTNARLKAHLGLATPPAGAASLTVAGETRTFDDGTVLCFDDSFWHEARNDDGAAPRYVLSVDFWKEGLAAR